MRGINIYHSHYGHSVTEAAQMAKIAGEHFDIGQRVPEVSGEAFDLLTWYTNWLALHEDREANSVLPTILKVEAVDTFEATIPWDQLAHAAVLFEKDGEPLGQNGPIRLYVPDGSSKCLNVKSIVTMRIECEANGAADAEREASYGFKHTFTKDDMFKK
ncbi:hypothetical protein [Paenibacillus sp. YIM B09110]|uniref:hypothetical protein n=1 Tax=Paenibacillus sp. YIM B09110 TaxID=3126102 RepID=UPI00301C0EE0